MRNKIFVKELEVCLGELAIAVPPHRVLGGRVDDRVLVLGRAASVHAGFGADRAALYDGGFAGRNRMLVKLGRVEIPMNCSKVFKAELVGAVGTVPHTRLFHVNLRLKRPAAAGIHPWAPCLGTAWPQHFNYSACQR